MRVLPFVIAIFAADAWVFAAEPKSVVVAPRRVEVLKSEWTTRVRITGGFRACASGDCKESRPGVVELACPDEHPERCGDRITSLTKLANTGGCAMLPIEDVAIRSVDATFVPTQAFPIEGELVTIERNDPLCTHAQIVTTETEAPARRESYARWILTTDLVSALTVPLLLGIGGYVLGGPIVHWSRGNVEKGFASLALRIAMPVGSGFLFTAPCFRSPGCGLYGLAFFMTGAAVGALGAVAIDASVIAHDERRSPRVAIGPTGLALSGEF